MDSYEPSQTASRPAPLESADWLNALTPLGAPALRCQPNGVHYAFQECVLPLTNPRHFDGPPSLGEPTDWLHRVLATVRRGGKPLKPAVIDRLAMMLAPGPRRHDGLPAYWPAPPNVGQTQAWAAFRQRDGSLGRAILAAVSVDLQGLPLEHVSAALLGLHDHEEPAKGGPVTRDPRRARAFRSEGRWLVGAVGVWPWTHALRGQLPFDWRTRDDFLEPLQGWHERAVSERERECARARAAFEVPLYD